MIYCNSLEVAHTREVFLLTFRFVPPNGKEETVHVAISPAGASTLYDFLGKEIESYVKKYGNIAVAEWETGEKKRNKEDNNNNNYVS